MALNTGAVAKQTSGSEQSSITNQAAYTELQLGNYDAAYKLSLQALEQSKLENNLVEKARALSNVASNLNYIGDSEKALSLYSESLDISLKINDLEGADRALNNLASVFSELGDYGETLKYRELQLANSLESNNFKHQIAAYIGLAQLYIALVDIEQAKRYILLAREIIAKHPNLFEEIYLLFSETSILESQQKWEEATELLKVALKIATEHNYNGLVLSIHVNIAQYLLEQKKYQQAINKANSLLSSAQEIQLRSKELQLHTILSKAYEGLKNYEKTLYHERQANQIEQQISGERVKLAGEITKIDRLVSEQQEQLIKLEKDQEILSLMLDKQKQNLFIWLTLFVMFFGLSFFLYYRYSSEKEIQRQKELNRQLEELDKVKDKVLTNTSHELRTPLNGIIGLSDIIIKEEENSVSETTLKCLKLIKSSGEQLARVINDILELSKLKNNKLILEKSSFDLQQLIDEVIAICQPSAEQQPVSIENRNRSQQMTVFQDRGRLQQVLFNIIGNAIKFTPAGSITISSKLKAERLFIIIKDTGIGIPKDKLERVFKGFEQVDAGSARQHSGTGLGLAISRGIIETSYGKLSLTSELGQGTTVSIILPN